MFCQMYPQPITPYAPWYPQVEASGGQEWYNLGLHWPELMFYCLQCSIDHLEFYRVLCNRLSSFFRCHPSMPPTPPVGPLDDPTPPQYRHLVVKSGTTAGQYDMLSSCMSGWCLVRCTPSPNPTPLVEASSGQEQYYIRSAWQWSAFGSGWPAYLRVNLVPAAMVIPAPWVDIKVVADKKLIC